MSASKIFGQGSRWTAYRGELRIETFVGGIPKDPDTIRKFLTAKLKLGDAQLQQVLHETLSQMRPDGIPAEGLPIEELVDIVAGEVAKGNGFKSVDGQLMWEGRCLKAALREAANILYPYDRGKGASWPGAPARVQKKLASWLEERVEVRDRLIPLGRTKPDIEGEQRIKHITGPKGKQSTINVVDVCFDVTISFVIDVLDDCISPVLWSQLWEQVERGGVGPDRARGDGRCELVRWELLDGNPTGPNGKPIAVADADEVVARRWHDEAIARELRRREAVASEPEEENRDA